MSNANIILSGRAPQIDRADNRKRAYDAVNAEQRHQLNSLALGSQMQEMDRSSNVRNALSGLNPNAPDYYSQAASAAAPFDPMAGADFAATGRAVQAQEAQQRSSELDALVKQSQVISGALYGVERPEDIPRMRGYLENNGIDISGMPNIQTPEDAQAFALKMQPMADRLKQEFELEKFEETKRQNQYTRNKPDAPVEIYDETSPTGTRMASREGALGQPGKPGSGMSITLPDGTVVESGRRSGQGGPLRSAVEGHYQKEIVDAQQALDGIEQMMARYDPRFLTYKGAGVGKAATIINKLDPEQRSQFQAQRAAFLSSANRQFLAYRKWATGVAGGEKEMAEIKRATFSEDDSPQDFEAKVTLARSLYRRLNARARAAISAGIDPKNELEFRKFIHANPLESIPSLQERGDELSNQGHEPGQVTEILKQEGYY